MYKHLTQAERYYIWHRRANLFESIDRIALALKRSPSTIRRELSRNLDDVNEYAPDVARC